MLFFAVWPRVFGRRNLGQIQGAAQAITVLASAVGPLLLAWCVELTGSYAMMFAAILAAVIGMVALAAWLVTLPEPIPSRSAPISKRMIRGSMREVRALRHDLDGADTLRTR